MSNARQVKQRISTATNIAKITKAMEMVSASKMRKAQELTLAARPFALALRDSLRKVARETTPDLHPLLSRHSEGQDVIVIISTDRGLCGSLNQTIFKSVIEWYKEHPQGTSIIVGKKGIAFAQYFGLPVFAQFTAFPDNLQLSHVLPLVNLLVENFTNKAFHSVTVAYMDFINTLSQKLVLLELLPICEVSVLANDSEESLALDLPKEFTFEPSAKEILAELLPYYIENNVYQSFLESKASEHSARMVSMKNSSENAKELVTELKLVYNKSRQESITSELLEITTATLSLAD